MGTGIQMTDVGVVTALGNILSLPQRGAVAVVKQVAQRHGGQGSKYADAGEAFVDAAEWGALLEDLAPFLPKPVRQALSIPMDIALDPLIAVPPAKVAATLAPIASKLPGAVKATEAGRWVGYQMLKQLHPTLARELERQALEIAPELARLGYIRDPQSVWQAARARATLVPESVEYVAASGGDQYLDLFGQLRRAIQEANRIPADVATTNWADILANLNLEELPATVREVVRAKQDEWLKQLAAAMRLQPGETADKALAELERQMGSILGLEHAMPIPEQVAALREALRRVGVDAEDPSGWQRAMAWWKRAVTSFNLPAGWVRNFLGNFLAHYLANEPLKLSQRPLRELLQEAFSKTTYTRAGDIGADVLRRGEPPKNAMLRWVAEKLGGVADWAGRTYSSADKLAAAVLSKITDKPVEHFLISESFRLPERIEWLSRVGLIPFATWPTFIVPRLARGFWENPARWHRLSMALKALGAEERGTNIYKPLPNQRAINIEPFLPISPYMFSASEGNLPELLQRWPPLAFGRDISDALAGAPPKPAALATESPLLNALITASNYALPPSFWNALRLYKPEWFADIPRSPLTPSDYLWRLLGLGIIRNPEQYEVLRRRRELEKLRRLMRRVGVRQNQMENEETEE